MTIDFDSLVTRQTLAEIRTAAIAAANVVGWSVSSLPPLARLRKLALDVVPVLVQTATAVHVDAIRGGLLDFAAGLWVDLLAASLFGIDGGRIAETFATTPVTFTNAGLTPYTFAALEVTVGNAATGATYRNSEPFSLAAVGFVGASATVDVIATAIGSGSSAAAGDITEMVTQFDGVTCTNASVANGTDLETDELLKLRCRLSRAALSNAGHDDAIEFVARSARRADGTAIGVTRVQIVNNVPSMGDVAVYLADTDGGISSDDADRIDYLIRTLVLSGAVNYLGAEPATDVTINIVYTARARARDGATAAEIQAAVAADLNALLAAYPVGGYIVTPPDGLLFRSEILATISQAQVGTDGPRPVIDVPSLTPGSNTTLAPGEVPVLGTITPTTVLL